MSKIFSPAIYALNPVAHGKFEFALFYCKGITFEWLILEIMIFSNQMKKFFENIKSLQNGNFYSAICSV